MKLTEYLALNPKKHLIFDLDETLVTLVIDWSAFRIGLWKLVEAFDPQLAQITPDHPGTGFVLYNRVVLKHGHSGRQKVLDYCGRYEQQKITGYKPNKELVDFILGNHHRYRYYIWSSNNQDTVNRAVEYLKIKRYFDKIVCKEDVDLLKPYPDGFYHIFNPAAQERKDYLMIGDKEQDAETARQAGIDYLERKNRS